MPADRLRFRVRPLPWLLGIVLTASAVTARADEAADIQALLRAGKAADAVKAADQALASKPKDASLRFLKGVALAEQQRPADAIAVFQKLTEDYPELPEPYNNLAVLHAGQGQYDRARTALEMAIRTNPSYATAYENLGDVYAKLASQAYSKALQVAGGNTAAAPKLALIRELFAGRGAKATGGAPAASLSSTVAAARATVQAAPAPAPKPATVVAAAPAPAAPKPATAPAPAPAAVPPAPAPAPAQAVKAPAPPPAAAAAADAQRDVQAAVQAWAQAWSRKDVDGYFAAYTPAFDGGKGRKAWQDERRSRIVGKRSIKVGISALSVEVNGDKAVAKFRQDYAADALNVSSRKTLDLVRQGGKWLIVRESTGS